MSINEIDNYYIINKNEKLFKLPKSNFPLLNFKKMYLDLINLDLEHISISNYNLKIISNKDISDFIIENFGEKNIIYSEKLSNGYFFQFCFVSDTIKNEYVKFLQNPQNYLRLFKLKKLLSIS